MATIREAALALLMLSPLIALALIGHKFQKNARFQAFLDLLVFGVGVLMAMGFAYVIFENWGPIVEATKTWWARN